MANVSDEDGDLMNVTFYWDNGSKIYSLNTKNGTISIAVHLEYGTNYIWKVVVNDSMEESIAIHHFSTIERTTANFTHSFIFENETAYFNDNSTGMIQQWLWQFGDGATSNEKNTTHIYKKSGCYVVNLTVVDIYGRQFSIKKIVHVWKRGDVNMDGKINALDVTSLEILIATNNTAAAPPPADANSDNVIDEDDINKIIEMIVGR
ncbi:MAG: PKD domain-containing protein [Thermoplasmata archaeon]|nr:PKD domain-containing protein [Thermoplasmata archaeon]